MAVKMLIVVFHVIPLCIFIDGYMYLLFVGYSTTLSVDYIASNVRMISE